MKKLNKLEIQTGRILKKEELLSLKGGNGYFKCVLDNNQTCYEGAVRSCDDAYFECNTYCPDWDYLICTGW